MTLFDTPFNPGSPWQPFSQCSSSEYTTLAEQFATEYKSLGWFDAACSSLPYHFLIFSVNYAADEPSTDMYPDIRSDGLAMQSGDPDWKTQTFDTVQARVIDIWFPVLTHR